MMTKILVLLVLIASPFSSAQSEADILNLRPTGFRPAPLTGETSLDYLSLLREISRNTHQRLAEMDYLLTGNVIVPRSLVPTVHELELPSFTRLDHIADDNVQEFADHLKGYSDMALAPLVNVLSASHAVLMKAYQSRYRSLTGYRDLSLDTIAQIKRPLDKLKELTDSIVNVKTGLDGLRIRALAYLDGQQEKHEPIHLTYPKFLHEVRVDLFEQRLRRAQVAWADLQSQIAMLNGRDRVDSLGRWVDTKNPIDQHAVIQLGAHYLTETSRLLKRVRLLARSADNEIANSFSTHDNVVPLFSPGTQPAQRAVSQNLNEIQPKWEALYFRMRELYEMARDLRALYLENPGRFQTGTFGTLTPAEREARLQAFELAAKSQLEDLYFLIVDSKTLGQIWSENGSFSHFVERQWPQWQKATANAREALLKLEPVIRTSLTVRGCAHLLSDPPEPSAG